MFDSPQVKRDLMSSAINVVYKLLHEELEKYQSWSEA